MSEKMKNLQDLLEEQIKDLYNAESQIIDALPKMVEKASNNNLKQIFQEHLVETKAQKERLEEVCQILNCTPKGEKCKAMEGLIKEAESFIKEDANAPVMDAGLIANAQRVEHYEIAAYGTVLTYAKHLGLNEVVNILKETMEEEKNADSKLTDIAVESINEEAVAH